MQRKKILLMALIGIMAMMSWSVFSIEAGWASSETVKVVIDGEQKAFNPAALINDGVTWVPVRGISDCFGAEVVWEEENQLVHVSYVNTNIILKCERYWVEVNGEKKDLDIVARNINGSMYVPIRFASVFFGAQVMWNDGLKQVEIFTNAPVSVTSVTALVNPKNDLTYTVKAGDTIYGIASVTGISQETIIAANNLSNPQNLSVGQTLILPEVNRDQLDTLASRGSIRRSNGENSDIVAIAKKYIGTPYHYGGTTTRAFDCSGYIGYIYKQVGVSLPRTSRDQSRFGTWVTRGGLIPGDLIFFTTNGTGGVSHVGMYIGNDQFIHASSKHGVTITSLSKDYYTRRYVTARRVR